MAKFGVETEEEGANEPVEKKLKSSSSSSGETSIVDIAEREGKICVTIDPDILDCSICFETLSPPVFQCVNGHIACSSCCKELKNKCPSCSWPIGYNRCRAIEKVLESIKVTCPYAIYGCTKSIDFLKKGTHEETCTYTPCTCPVSDCNFVGSFDQLSIHLNSKHRASSMLFIFGCPLTIFFGKNDPFVVLRGPEGLLFLLNNKMESNGNAISLVHVGPNSAKQELSYDITIQRDKCSLRLQSCTRYSSKKCRDGSSSMDFLLVPHDFCGNLDQIRLEVCIGRNEESCGDLYHSTL